MSAPAVTAPTGPAWEDLRIFLLTARALSMSAAARELGVDRATASRRVAALEQSLGAKLFLRSRAGLRLSAAGERVRAQVERMSEAARALSSRAFTADREVEGKVRLATTEALAPFLVARGLLRLRDRHPGLTLEIAAGNKPLDLALGEADLALRPMPPKDAGLKVRRLARMPLALYASPAYLLARARPRPSDLAGHDALLPGDELAKMPEARWLAEQAGISVAFVSNSMPALVAAAVAGHGLVVLPRPWGDAEGGLARCFELDAVPARPLWLVLQPDSAERAAVRAVADAIAEIVSRAA